MPTKWVVTVPTDRIELDDAQQGQTTFTVTNPSSRVDRVYFDVVTSDGADESWFTVDEPQRRVPASGSVSYLVKTAIPATAKPGTYSVQGRAYSADSAPEEDSVLSGRLAVEVKPKAAPAAKKKFPWWIVVVAALVVIVLVVVGVLVFGGNSTPEPVAAQEVLVPDLAHQSESQAKTNLAIFGLSVGNVQHKLDATPDQVLYQSVAGGGKALKGSAIDLVITTNLAAPEITAPANNAVITKTTLAAQVTPVPKTPPLSTTVASPSPSSTVTPTATPTATPQAPGVIQWTDSDPFVTRWQVLVMDPGCTVGKCFAGYNAIARVDQPSYTPILWLPEVPGGQVVGLGKYTIQVAAVDDFGNVGPYSAPINFSVN
ncbi:MAG TPA: PASTA domain-containing protein [Micromonosporaceae bacterium]|nr:PASTA domain-containing protein [Micromonosporaceae bacterium]